MSVDRKNKNKNKNKSLFEIDNSPDTSVSDAINEAFDNVELSTVGKLCMDARLNKGFTQEQAGALLKVRVKIIKDFENGDQIDLPGLAYKVGFVRSYARLLDLDGDLLVKEFKESLELNDFKEEYKFLTPEMNRNNFLPLSAVFSVLIAVLFYTGWYYSDRNNKINDFSEEKTEDLTKKTASIDNNNYVIIEESSNSRNLTSTSNIDTNLKKKINSNKSIDIQNLDKKNSNDVEIYDKEISQQKAKIEINNNKNKTNELSATANERDPSTEMVLRATGNSWVEIEDLEGNILMTRLMRPGETYVVPKINGLTFNTGNAGALSLSQGDLIIPKLGEIGEIITARPLNIKNFSKSSALD